jgi:arsenite-transporting ATPase
MAILETARLIGNLNEYGIKVGQLVINNVLQSDGCRFCTEKMKEQDKYINHIRKKFNGLRTVIAGLRPHEIKGLKALTDLNRQLFN